MNKYLLNILRNTNSFRYHLREGGFLKKEVILNCESPDDKVSMFVLSGKLLSNIYLGHK